MTSTFKIYPAYPLCSLIRQPISQRGADLVSGPTDLLNREKRTSFIPLGSYKHSETLWDLIYSKVENQSAHTADKSSYLSFIQKRLNSFSGFLFGLLSPPRRRHNFWPVYENTPTQQAVTAEVWGLTESLSCTHLCAALSSFYKPLSLCSRKQMHAFKTLLILECNHSFMDFVLLTLLSLTVQSKLTKCEWI